MIFSILIFLAILSILVLIHEFGHFIVAKKFNIKVEEFGFGFPPRVWGTKRGETLFSVNLFPIGGFVKLHGEDAAGSGRIGGVEQKGLDEKRSFYNRPPWQRAAVSLAGVVMNFLLAVVIFYALFSFTNFTTTVPLLGEYKFWGAQQENVAQGVYIASVQDESPAAKGGVREGSTVISLNGEEIDSVGELVEIVDANRGEEVDMRLLDNRRGEEYSVEVVARAENAPEEGGLGVAIEYIPMKLAVVSYESLMQKMTSGVTYPINFAFYSIQIFGDLISESFAEKSIDPVGEGVAGPVGIYAVVDQVVQSPDPMIAFLQVLNIAGILSISLAFFNILPIPALDGGRLAFIIIEKIFGRGISVKYESYAHAVGMVVLLGLMILITIRDIGRFF